MKDKYSGSINCKKNIVLLIEGGCLQAVYADREIIRDYEITLVDKDNITTEPVYPEPLSAYYKEK